MNKNDIIQMINSWENLNFYLQHLSQHTEHLPVLLAVALDESKQEYWRAAYLVDKLADLDPKLIAPYIPNLIEALKTTQNKSKLRHFLKIISQYPIPVKEFDFLFDYCLQVFTNADYPIAVRVHAMQILYEISETEHGLKPELIQLIEHEIDLHPTPGIKSRGKKLLYKLTIQCS